MSKQWTDEQRQKYNEANKARQAEIRRLAKEKKQPAIQITIMDASPELLDALRSAMEVNNV